MQEARPAPSNGMTDSAFLHPFFGDQLFRNHRHRASLQPGMARQVGARHRLMASDQVQNDSSVDIPRCLAGGYLKVLEINPSHVERAIIRRANYSLTIILSPRKELARMHGAAPLPAQPRRVL